MPNTKIFAVFCILSAASANVLAADVRPVGLVGLYFGGDNLIETNIDDLDAGGLFYFGGGIHVAPQNSNMAFQVTLGYKFDSIDFDIPSGDSSISSMPLEITAYIRNYNVRIGGGIAYHIGPEWELCISGFGCDTVKFDDALGLIVELAFDLQQNAFLGVRYTSIDYEVGGASIDASNLGFNLGLKF